MRIVKYFFSLFFPNYCLGCETILETPEEQLCIHCLSQLPPTSFSKESPNSMEQLFWGKVQIEHASALYYFSKSSRLQEIIHQLKYKGRKEIGFRLGKVLGNELKESPNFQYIDMIIPVPLHKKKKNKRGFNQSEIIAKGVSEEMHIPLNTNTLFRKIYTNTQTHKKRLERWENVNEVFSVESPNLLENKHILLIDDVITTGSTLISCIEQLSTINNIKISVATLAYAGQ